MLGINKKYVEKLNEKVFTSFNSTFAPSKELLLHIANFYSLSSQISFSKNSLIFIFDSEYKERK